MYPILIQGILYDQKSSFLRGPASAPPLIRQSLYSEAYNSYAENGKAIHADNVHAGNDFQIKTYFDISAITEENLKVADRLLTLGGDHSITYPILKAYHNKYPTLTILQIDAHTDLYDEFEGDKHSHACPFARIMEEGLARHLIQIGIRTLTPHLREQAARFKVEMVEMKDFDIQNLPPLEGPIYLSLDLDGIDPAFAPGVSHQEAGGLTSREVIKIIQSIKGPLVGADIVEYNPIRDANGITAALAGKLAKEVLGKMLE